MSNDLLLPEFGLSCLSRAWVTHEYLMSFIWVLPSDKMATHFVTHMLLTCNEFCPSFTCVPPWVLPEYVDLEWVLPLDKMATQSLLRKVSKNFFSAMCMVTHRLRTALSRSGQRTSSGAGSLLTMIHEKASHLRPSPRRTLTLWKCGSWLIAE